MRIGMRLLLGYFLIVAVAAVFVLSIFVQEIKPGVRRATEGTLIDTATLLAALARDDLLSGNPTDGQLAKAFAQLQHRPFRANISGIVKVRNEYHVYMTDAQGRCCLIRKTKRWGRIILAGMTFGLRCADSMAPAARQKMLPIPIAP